MSVKIKFSNEARTELFDGVETLAKAVVSTLGPNGRNVVIKKKDGSLISTKDGVTVAKNIELEDELKELGVRLIKEASIQTNDKAGDGTTTSTLLAYSMIKNGLNKVNDGFKHNPVDIKRDIDKAVKQVVAELKNISEDISDNEQLKQISTISANNDHVIGDLISRAINKVGMDGVIYIEESKTYENMLDIVEGMQFDRGYKSPYFVTDNNKMESILENPLIFVTSEKLASAKDIVSILETAQNQNRSILLIADDIDHEALAISIVNKSRGTIKMCAVKAPGLGDIKELLLEDIAISVGAKVVSKKAGYNLQSISMDYFDSARNVVVNKEQTTIIDGKGDPKLISERVENLKNQIDIASSSYVKEKLQERLSRFVGGAAIIHIGGFNEVEIKEAKDRAEDALHAVRAAIHEGIVTGGGVALLAARKAIELDSIGAEIVYKACEDPFKTILLNAGYSDKEITGFLKTLDEKFESKEYNYGVDVSTDKIQDFKSLGIIDPTKVTRTALENAASAAGNLLLTECVISSKTPEDPTQGMMGGMF